MEIIDLIDSSIETCRVVSGDPQIVLYVDEFGLHEGTDGILRYLPMLVSAGQPGYMQFLPELRDRVSGYFGADFERAEELAEEINEDNGIPAAAAYQIVGKSMRLQRQTHRGLD